MAKLDHIALDVGDLAVVREWYCDVLGLVVEFESGDPPVAGLNDDGEMTLLLAQQGRVVSRCSLYFQVADVAATYADLTARGVTFLHAPQQNPWGYGAELLDPDGRLVGLWDEQSMHAGG